MRYILDERYRFRGWQKSPAGIFDTHRKEAIFLPKEQYLFVLYFDGAHDLDEETLPEEKKKFLEELKRMGIVRPAGFAEFLKPEQEYRTYPAQYKKQAHWSVTGACNLKCRHCFMSAPNAKHGSPSHEQIIAIADQLAECGVFQVGLTGGEPLIREDFLDIVDALNEREIGIDVIFTNGWLVDEAFLDELEKRHVHPPFQLSFDGVGMHDFLRGIPGAEERTISALKLLQKREHPVSVSMCMHRRNRHVLRESVNLMASLGVRSMKCGGMMQLGEWARPELADLQLTNEEELQMFEEYIPQYFEDNAPLSIMMSGVFMYTPGDERWSIYNHSECSAEDEMLAPSCGVLRHNFYIGAEGMVAPCMGMADCGYAKNFPNLFETPLREILGDSEFNRLCNAKVGEVRDAAGKCRDCRFIDRCTGGCRNAALMAGDDYYGIDPDICWFFENNGEERITAAAEEAFAAYIRRNPPVKKEREKIETDVTECP
ncbi:MAG: radical SAM protein [Firmicutes bacterium]|nr:radical SAM protein [Bacillota bacterium]